MQFNKATTIELVKRGLTTTQRRDSDGIDMALGAAIDDLAVRTRSSKYLRSYDLSVAASAREATVSGNNEDLAHIFALKMSTGANQRVLEWVDPQSFLRDNDDPTATAGIPTKYSILTHDSNGWPKVRFDSPLESADTMTVLYYITLTDSAPVPLPVQVLVQGTLAYFLGSNTPEGSVCYERFKEGCRLERSGAEMNPEGGARFRLPRFQRGVMAVQRSIRKSRR